MSRLTPVLLALGDVPEETATPDRKHAEEIAKELGLGLKGINTRLLTGGRKGTLADIALGALTTAVSAEVFRSVVSTYLPAELSMAEVPLDDFVQHGTVVRIDGPLERRREAMVQDADLLIVMGVGRGISEIVRLAGVRGRFVIPIPCAGGPAVDLHSALVRPGYGDESADTALRTLTGAGVAPAEVARACVSLVDAFRNRTVGLGRVFLAMPFVEAFTEREAAVNALERACKPLGLVVDIARATTAQRPVITEITMRIQQSAVLVAFLDQARPNVYFEAGYGAGLGKPIILCIKEGTDPAFDVQAFEQVRWRDAEDLENQLHARLKILIAERLIVAWPGEPTA